MFLCSQKQIASLVFLIIISFSTLFLEAQGTTKPSYQSVYSSGEVIWGFDFVSEEKILLSERSGKLLLLDLNTKKAQEISGLPKTFSQGQGGLLDVRLHPKDKTIVYLSFSEPNRKGARTSLLQARLKQQNLVEGRVLFQSDSHSDKNIHFGSRIEFDGEGHLFLSIGDRGAREEAQNLASHKGKIVRLNLDGSIPKDNPFYGQKGKRSEIWSYGHRNPQGLSFDTKEKKLYSTEMGPRGGDEFNLIFKGQNYGWPKVTYGKEYWGPSIGVTKKEGVSNPVLYWVPSISPSAVHFYRGSYHKKWQNSFFLACLSGTQIRRLWKDQNSQKWQQEELFQDLGFRFRNIRSSPKGALYFSTDHGVLAKIER